MSENVTSLKGQSSGSAPSIYDSIFHPGGRVGFLIAHGLGGSPADVRYLVQNLARAGFTVSCPVMAGHGSNRHKLNETRWNDWYASIEEAHDQLRERCDRIIVGGLSVGGVTALHLAAKRPQSVHGLCLLAPTMWPNGWAVPWYFHLTNLIRHKWAAELLRLPEREPFGIKDERLRRFVTGVLETQPGQSRLSGLGGGTLLEFRWMVQAVRGILGGLKQPALIIHPRQDDRASLSNVAYLQKNLGGLVETLVLDDSYHMITLDRQRDLVVERVVAFGNSFAEQAGGAAAAGRPRSEAG